MANKVLRKKIEFGRKFGILTVLEEAESRFFVDKRDGYTKRIRRVKCKCDCGVILDRDYDNLPKQVKRNQSPSCGCINNRPKIMMNDITPIIGVKNMSHKDKGEIISDLINKNYTNKEIILKTGVSSSYISTLRAKMGKLTFTINKIKVGDVYGRVTVLKVLNLGEDLNSTRRGMVIGKCECGTIKEFRGSHLSSGGTKSCGCLMRESARSLMMNGVLPKHIKHSDSIRKSPQHYLYHIWMGMKGRCYEPKNKRYDRYGARGIQIYEPWINDYTAFKEWVITNIGDRPKSISNKRGDGYSFDRINNDGNYEPGNLKWSTFKEQMNNRYHRETKSRNPKVRYREVYERYFNVKIKDGYEIHHIDWNKENNDPYNLMEVTSKEHGWLHRKKNYGLTTKTAKEIRDILNNL